MKGEIVKDLGAGVLLGEALLYIASIHAHREMSHGSVRLSRPLREAARFALLFGTGIDSRQYAAVHTYHHATADTEHDPHSPAQKGKVKVLLGTGFLNRKARKQITTILTHPTAFDHKGGENDPAFIKSETGEVTLRDHPAELLLRRGGVAYALGLGLCMAVAGPKRGMRVFGASTATFLGVTGAINTWGHVGAVTSHPEVPGTNMPAWTALPTAGEGPGHNDHHFDPSNPRIPTHDISDPGFDIMQILEKIGLAKIESTQ